MDQWEALTKGLTLVLDLANKPLSWFYFYDDFSRNIRPVVPAGEVWEFSVWFRTVEGQEVTNENNVSNWIALNEYNGQGWVTPDVNFGSVNTSWQKATATIETTSGSSFLEPRARIAGDEGLLVLDSFEMKRVE